MDDFKLVRESHIEDLMNEIQLIHDCLGLTSFESYKEYVENVVNGLKTFGSEMLIALGKLIEICSVQDQIKLLRLFMNEASQAEMMTKVFLAKTIGENGK